MPHSGPIFGDGFRYPGTFHPVARNVPAEPTATHGEGWISPWTVINRSPNATRLAFDYAPYPAAFPFAWHGEIEYRVDQARVRDRAEARQSRQPADADGPRVPSLFSEDAGNPPRVRLHRPLAALSRNPFPAASNRSSRASISAGARTSTGSSSTGATRAGTASRRSPRRRIEDVIEASPVFGKLQVYDAWDYPRICIELVTNANDGFNRAALGVPGHAVVDLAPGESLGGRIVISAE